MEQPRAGPIEKHFNKRRQNAYTIETRLYRMPFRVQLFAAMGPSLSRTDSRRRYIPERRWTDHLRHSIFPRSWAIYDGLNAEPHGIVNFKGTVAIGYTSGTATDSNGHTYNIGTDIRVYQGTYVGAMAALGGGGTASARAHGTFVEI
jgi:hypothetical protein